MTIVTLICISAVALILGVLFSIYKSSTDILNLAFKMLAPAACLMLALVSANLSSSFGGYTLFICLALTLTITFESYKCVKPQEKDNKDVIFLGIINAFSLLSLLAAGMIVIEFKILALAAGLLLGLCAFSIICIFKELSLVKNLLLAFNLVFAGMVLGQALALVLTGGLFAIFYLIASVCLLFNTIFDLFVGEKQSMRIVSNASRILALLLFAFSIFLIV